MKGCEKYCDVRQTERACCFYVWIHKQVSFMFYFLFFCFNRRSGLQNKQVHTEEKNNKQQKKSNIYPVVFFSFLHKVRHWLKWGLERKPAFNWHNENKSQIFGPGFLFFPPLVSKAQHTVRKWSYIRRRLQSLTAPPPVSNFDK